MVVGQSVQAETAGTSALEATPLDGPFGVVVRGIDWDSPCEDEVMLIKQLLRRNLLIVFRGQPSPSYEQKDQFFSRFGRKMMETYDGTFHYDLFNKDDQKPIFRKNDGNYLVNAEGGTSELIWHTDHFHKPQIKTISVLEALEFEPGAAPTMFRDSYTAFELLPEALKRRLKHKVATYFDPRLPAPDKMPRLCDATHPLFRTHPESERTGLLLIDYTARIVGMPLEESQALIAELKDFVEAYAPVYIHNWEPGDLVMWDNVGLHHKRPAVAGSFRRVMRQYEGVAEA